MAQEKYKSKPWTLVDDTGQQQFQGHLEGGQQATYFFLTMHGSEFIALPASSWYKFFSLDKNDKFSVIYGRSAG